MKEDNRNIKDLLKNLSKEELMQCYSDIIIALKEKGIIRTKNIVGEFGEYYAIKKYNETSGVTNLSRDILTGTEGVDATGKNGKRYSIKTTTGSSTGNFFSLTVGNSREIKEQKFDYLIIIKLDKYYLLEKVIEITWEKFLKYKKWHKTTTAYYLTITKKLLEDSNIIYSKESKK